MRESARGGSLVFMLHKQALAAGRVSLVDSPSESPLGAVVVRVEHPDPARVVDWLAPPTKDGRPIYVAGLPEGECDP